MFRIARTTTVAFIISCLYPLGSAGQSVPVIEPEPLPEPPPEVSDWYLRGDIAYQFGSEPGVTYNQAVAPMSFANVNLDNTGRVGIGAGRRIGDVLRTDVTADFSFKTGLSGNALTPCGPATCATVERADMWSMSLLANAYIDLGYYAGISPYIGGGLGVSYLHWDYNGGLGRFDDDDVRFTWALMAGLSYDIDANWSVDAGYRFLNTPEGEIIGNNAALSGPVRFDDLTVHTIRLGIRYSPGGPES